MSLQNINFYQSKLRRYINEAVYKRKVFEIDFLGKTYFGIIKEKKGFRWYQVLGVHIQYISNTDNIKQQLVDIKKTFNKSFYDIFFQFGFIDIIASVDCNMLDDENIVKDIYNKRVDFENKLKINLGMLPSFRENMPLATIVFDLSKGIDGLYKEMRKSAKSHIKKAFSRKLYFKTATNDDEWQEFYDIWQNTASTKGFNIIPKSIFFTLREYIQSEKAGDLFLAKLNDKIVSGSLCFFVDDWIVYMYGATNRDFGNIGGHQFLKYQIFDWGIKNGFKGVDLLGVAPTGFKNHHLGGVSSFKQSLGGIKIEYLGNYDMVLNNMFYKIFKILKT